MKQPMSSAERRICLYAWIVALVMLTISLAVYVATKPVTVSFIDVGQGDACLVQAGKGGAVLIDGGDEGAGLTLSSYLAKQNVRALDAVILSHLHSDHYTGVKELIEDGFPIRMLYLSGIPFPEEEEELFALTQKAGISICRLMADSKLTLGKATYHVLWPQEKAEYMQVNNQSLVLRMEYGENRILFTGDIEAAAQAELALYPERECRADVLKVPHHGGSTAVYRSFLERVHPRFAVIGVGMDNYHGHPHPKMLDALSQIGCQTLRTDLNGTVKLVLHKDKIARIETTDKWRMLK